MPSTSAIIMELIKACFAIGILMVTWLVGQRVISFWELKRKRKELDIAAADQFQLLFGEFKEIWRLWKVYQSESRPSALQDALSAPPEARWDLLCSASAAEGRLEALFVKLSTERNLSETETYSLGLFRQAYQLLRQGIRDGKPLAFSYRDPEYKLFNELGCEVTRLIGLGNAGEPPTSMSARHNFERILSVRTEAWDQQVSAVRAKMRSPTG